ncbi:MAG: hypothetical protein QXZ44_01450 [Ferroplasma sp.]
MFVFDHRKISKKLENVIRKAKSQQTLALAKLFIIEEKETIKEEYDSNIATLISETFINEYIDSEFYKAINYIDSNHIICKIYRAKEFYEAKNYGLVLNEVKACPDVLKNAEINNLFMEVAGNLDAYSRLLYFSYAGKLIQDAFSEFFGKAYDFGKFCTVINNYLKNTGIDTIAGVIEQCYKATSDINCLYFLADIYMQQNMNSELKILVNSRLLAARPLLNKKLEEYFYALREYKNVLEYSEPGDAYDIMLADALKNEGYFEKALAIYKNIYNDKDKNVLNRIIGIEFLMGNYYSALNHVNSLEKINDIPDSFKLERIEAEIKLELYDEAGAHLKKYAIGHTGNDVINLEVKYFKAIGDEENLYNSVRKLMLENKASRDDYEIIVNYLFSRERYKDLVEFLISNKIEEEFKSLYCASLIYLGEFDKALSLIKGDMDLLDIGDVIDALFMFARNDFYLSKFETLDYSKTLFAMAIAYIRGERSIEYYSYIDRINKTNSIACTYIISAKMVGNNFDLSKNYVRSLLCKNKYSKLNSIVQAIERIDDGEISCFTTDSVFFMYPITAAIIRAGRYDDAQNLLLSINHGENDAFYFYYSGLIFYMKGKYNEAIKDIDAAISILKNSEFLILRMKAGLLVNGNVPGELIDIAVREKFCFIFDTISEFIKENKIELNSAFIESLKKYNLKQASFYRILAYYSKTYKDQAKYSAKALQISNSAVDANTHFAILSLKDASIALSFLTLFKHKNAESYMILGMANLGSKKYYSALANFNNNIIRGGSAIKNKDFQEFISNDEIYRTLYQLLNDKGDYLNLVLLYYYRKEFSKLKDVPVTGSKYLKIFKFLIDSSWEVDGIKQLLLSIFEKSKNRVEGELLAEKFDREEDYGNEADILKAIIDDYPDELSILDRLLHALEMDGRYSNAMELIYTKFYKNKNYGLFLRLAKTYYFLKDYSSLINIFDNNAEFISKETIKFYIYSELKLFNYQKARYIRKEYRDYIDSNLNASLDRRVSISYRIDKIISDSGSLLEASLNANDSGYEPGGMPESMIEDINDFLNSDEPYSFIDPEYYNGLSKNILKRIYEMGKTNILEVEIRDIYAVTKNVITSKNFYIFINRALENEYIKDYNGSLKLSLENILNGKCKDLMYIIAKFDIGLLDAISIFPKIIEEKCVK